MTICSLVLQAKPQYLKAVKKALKAMDGIEVHGQNDVGKIVVTIDHPSRDYCSQAMTEMSLLKGVMSSSLVFEYQEDLEQKSTIQAHDQTAFEQEETPAIQRGH